MDNFGYKVVDRSKTEVQPIIAAALQNGRPIEVGLFFLDASTQSYLQAELVDSSVPVNTHLDHNVYNVFSISGKLDGLRTQLERALSLGSAYSILHVAAGVMTSRRATWPKLMERLGDHLEAIEQVCTELDHCVYVENTFHSIPFYEAFFLEANARGLKRIHQCFDIGHAKVWSDEPLAEWLDFLDKQQRQDRRMHFHLHANQGFNDDHLSFVEADRRGIIAADAYLGEWDYFSALKQIGERFPSSRKVFEVPPEHALSNMDLVLRRLAA